MSSLDSLSLCCPPSSRAGCPSPGPRPVRALRREPTACLLRLALARWGRAGAAGGGLPVARGVRQGVQRGACGPSTGWARGAVEKAVCIAYTHPSARRWLNPIMSHVYPL